MDAKTARTVNIRTLVAEAGGPAAFAARHRKWVAAQVSQWISLTNPKPIGHKLAREIESATGLAHSWLDRPRDLNGSGDSGLRAAFTGAVSQDVRYSPETIAVAWNWVRFEEGPLDRRGRQAFAYPDDLTRAKRLLELCAAIHADGGMLTPEHAEALIKAARARQLQGGG